MKKIILTISIIPVLLFGLVWIALAGGNATLTLSPPSGSYKVGDTFKVTIFANPNGHAIDTVRANLSYSKELLEIQNFSLSSSFTFQSGGNGYDNSSGSFSYGAGIAGGISEGSSFGTITFKVKAQGSASVNIAPDSMVLSDGQDMYKGEGTTAFYSLASAVPPPAPVTQPTPKPVVKKQTSAPAPVVQETPSPAPEENIDLPIVLPENIPLAAAQETAASTRPGLLRSNIILFSAILVLLLAFVGGVIQRAKRKNKALLD